MRIIDRSIGTCSADTPLSRMLRWIAPVISACYLDVERFPKTLSDERLLAPSCGGRPVSIDDAMPRHIVRLATMSLMRS
jgi:hypothetical protein